MGGAGCSRLQEGGRWDGGGKPPPSPKRPVLGLWGQRGPVPVTTRPLPSRGGARPQYWGASSSIAWGLSALVQRQDTRSREGKRGQPLRDQRAGGKEGESGWKAALPFRRERLGMRVPGDPAWGPHALGTQGCPWLRKGLSSASGRRHQGKHSVAAGGRSYRAPNTEHRATPRIGRVPALPQETLQQAGPEQLSPSPALRNQASGLSPCSPRRQQGCAVPGRTAPSLHPAGLCNPP